jgi:hypothetical protein
MKEAAGSWERGALARRHRERSMASSQESNPGPTPKRWAVERAILKHEKLADLTGFQVIILAAHFFTADHDSCLTYLSTDAMVKAISHEVRSRTGRSYRTVKRSRAIKARRDLEKLGFLVVVEEGGGKGRVTIRRVACPGFEPELYDFLAAPTGVTTTPESSWRPVVPMTPVSGPNSGPGDLPSYVRSFVDVRYQQQQEKARQLKPENEPVARLLMRPHVGLSEIDAKLQVLKYGPERARIAVANIEWQMMSGLRPKKGKDWRRYAVACMRDNYGLIDGVEPGAPVPTVTTPHTQPELFDSPPAGEPSNGSQRKRQPRPRPAGANGNARGSEFQQPQRSEVPDF